MRAGVTMIDPGHTYVDAAVHLTADVTLFPGTVLQGRTVVGRGARIGPHTRLADCLVGEGAVVEQTVAYDAEIGAASVVGPFASLAAGAHIPPGANTGAFYTGRGGDDDGV
jgi:bifunctional UDP-N-acetylglucosamine pyrophosphorylase/glucosamine-1-phosphate N-acetyltransferase